MITRVFKWKRPRGSAVLAIGGVLVAAGLMAAAGGAVVTSDSGTVDVQIAAKTGPSKVDIHTAQDAFVSYFGDSDVTFGASGTGLFDPFVRIQASPTEEGFNTDAKVTLDAKTGTWTHAIKVSQIPQRPCPQVGPPAVGSETCFELFNDINENNTAKHISLNTVDIWFTDNANLSGYPFTDNGTTTTDQYTFNGDILINDVNQGSGRGDLRYDIPITKFDLTKAPNCTYGNPLCNTYFVLYSKWGTSTTGGIDYSSDGGFEEWKVKIYPIPATTLTTVSQTPANPVVPGTPVTIVVRETNTGNDTLTNVNVTGTGCTTWTPASVASLAPGAFADFTCTFSPTQDTAWTADGHGTDSSGAPVPANGEHTSGNVDVNDTTSATSAQNWLPNDSATITSAGGTALNGTLTIQLYTGGTCATGSEVSGQLYTFPLSSAASPVTRSTNNTSYTVSASGLSTVSWLVTFTSSDPAVQNSSHCESTALTITN